MSEHSAENDRGRSGEFVRLATAEKYLARALAAEDAIAALVPGLRAEAQRLRGINVLSVALWMDAEADRLERILPECDHTYPPANSDGTCPSCGKTRVTPPGEDRP